MRDELLHTPTDKPIFSGDRDNQVQWGNQGEAWVQSEFESSKILARKEKNLDGVKTFFGQTSFIGSWLVGTIYLANDSHLWGKFPYVWKNSQEKLESLSNYSQEEIWGV